RSGSRERAVRDDRLQRVRAAGLSRRVPGVRSTAADEPARDRRMVAPSVKGLNCPNCGAAIQLRSGELARTVACSSCAAVLDAKDPNLRVLQEFKGVMRWTPLIPLGTRGKLKGEPYEVIGFQVRGINVDDTDYLWGEYLPWNPPQGLRYLTEYDRHWHDPVVLQPTPAAHAAGA